MKLISRKEELVLLSIWKLRDNAYGVTITDQLAKTTGRYWSIGAVYDVLDRLTRKALVAASASDPLPERGGKSKRLYRITKDGHQALEEIREIHDTMWSDLPESALEFENP
ncbi:MAG: helix-turn-helix transcriptional regulator [Candidatus Zixiibacteriota bacterium]|nr:MAG: helix-turn-helix transcriptional regulator [candidate division Zixibacteria bacterium]